MAPTTKKIFYCSKCPKFYTRNLNLQIHNRSIHSAEQPFHCEHCDKRFASQDSRQKHELSVHTKTRKYSCNACSMRFSQSTTLRRHEKSKSHQSIVNGAARVVERSNWEEATPAEATKSATFTAVVEQVGGRQPSETPVRSAARPTAIHNIKIESPETTLQPVMPSPDSSALRAYAIAEPRRAKNHPVTFQCQLCLKRFTSAYKLRCHVGMHNGEHPFVCNICRKAFARQRDRKRHEDLHSGDEKKFVCRGTLSAPSAGYWGCGRRFARTDALSRHWRSKAGSSCIKPLLDREALERPGIPILEANSQTGLGTVWATVSMHDPPVHSLGSSLTSFPRLLVKDYPERCDISRYPPDSQRAAEDEDNQDEDLHSSISILLDAASVTDVYFHPPYSYAGSSISETDFWSNLKCCDMSFNSLHKLVAHIEDVHKDGSRIDERSISDSVTAHWDE